MSKFYESGDSCPYILDSCAYLWSNGFSLSSEGVFVISLGDFIFDNPSFELLFVGYLRMLTAGFYPILFKR